MVVLSTAGAAIVGLPLEVRGGAAATLRRRAPSCSQFFAIFYIVVQLDHVPRADRRRRQPCAASASAGRSRSLPAGLGISSVAGAALPTFPMFAVARGVESVLRGSFFRSGYELLFVPMDPDEKRRTKTFLDVTCDRAGDAVGAVIVQLLLFTARRVPAQPSCWRSPSRWPAAGLYLARRLDTLYLGVVARRLVQHGELTPIVVGSETGWTVLDLPARTRTGTASNACRSRRRRRRGSNDPRLTQPRRAAIGRSAPRRPGARRARTIRTRCRSRRSCSCWRGTTWCARARPVLEAHAAGARRPARRRAARCPTPTSPSAAACRGFSATRRRRSARSNGLVRGLDDTRFEVRYQCGRAIDRLLAKHDALRVDERASWPWSNASSPCRRRSGTAIG